MSFFLSLEKVRNERKYVCVQVTAGFKRHIYSFHLTFACVNEKENRCSLRLT